MKKVLVTIPCLLFGGTEYQTLNLVKALKDLGYDVKVLCYFEYDNKMVVYFKEAGADVELMTKSGIRPKKFRKLFFELFFGLKKTIKNYNPDIVHVQYMAPGSLSILILKLLKVRNIIATAHVPGHIYKRKWIPKFLIKYFLKAFICVSKSSEESFFNEKGKIFNKEDFKRGRKHFTIYNCIEKLPKNCLSEKNELNIGIVSRISYEKGIDILLKALPFVKNFHKLMIVGDGKEYKKEILDLANELKINDKIVWAGKQPREKIFDFYKKMDVVLIPSRFEGFGLSAIEAMSCGKIVIASNVDGLKEIIENGINGFLFEKENEKDLANKINYVIENFDKLENIRIKAKETVKNKFSFCKYKKKINDLYEAVLGMN